MNKNFGKISFLGHRYDDPQFAGSGYTFRAKVIHPKGGRQDGFVKFYNPATHRHAAANELLAYHVGQKLRTPIAETFPCYCEASQIKGRVPWIPANDTDTAHLCVATLAVAGFDYRLRRDSIAEFEARILRWAQAPIAALFDELIYNSDRHQNNFLSIDEHSMVLIDHERAFTGANWTLESLVAAGKAPSPGNYMARIILDSPSVVTQRLLARSAQSYVYTADFSLKDFPESFFDVVSILKLSMDDMSGVVDFLNQRRRVLPSLIKAQYDIEKRLNARTTN